MKKIFNHLKFTVLVISFLLSGNMLVAQTIHRPQKLFIKHGLQFQTWTFSGANEWPLKSTATNNISRSTTNYGNRLARYIRIQLPGDSEILSMAEVQIMSNGSNVAVGKSVKQSSTQIGGDASKANDGNTNGDWNKGSVTMTDESGTVQPWWKIDLGAVVPISNVVVYNRTDNHWMRLRGYHILASEQPFASNSLEESLANPAVYQISNHFPIGEEYENLPFTQDYYEKPMFNIQQIQKYPNMKWGLEKAPYGDQMKAGPTIDEVANGFLTPMQLSKLDNLVSMGFGDEENYSDNQVVWLTQWYNIAKEKYPNVLLHNNQYVGQWSDGNMRYYIKTAKPDIITYDEYFFSENKTDFGGGTMRNMYDYIARYRRLALEGTDGTGKEPIEFGQYLIGFRQGTAPWMEGGRYYASESQINSQIFGALTIGAKWLSAWRYTRGNRSYWIDNDGNLLPGYTYYMKSLKEFNRLSPYLSRLITTDIRFIPGQRLVNGVATDNARPSEIAFWNKYVGAYITNIQATNLVNATNNGLRGDVLVGYFRPVKNLDTDPDVSMAPIHHKDASYFMIMNGLTKPTTGLLESNNPQFLGNVATGDGTQTRQKIRVDIDFKANPVDELVRINRTTGAEETITLIPVSGTTYYFEIELEGGKGDLFYWKNAHTVTLPNRPVAPKVSDIENEYWYKIHDQRNPNYYWKVDATDKLVIEAEASPTDTTTSDKLFKIQQAPDGTGYQFFSMTNKIVPIAAANTNKSSNLYISDTNPINSWNYTPSAVENYYLIEAESDSRQLNSYTAEKFVSFWMPDADVDPGNRWAFIPGFMKPPLSSYPAMSRFFTNPTVPQEQAQSRYLISVTTTINGVETNIIGPDAENQLDYTIVKLPNEIYPGAVVDAKIPQIKINTKTSSFDLTCLGSRDNARNLQWTQQNVFIDWNQDFDFLDANEAGERSATTSTFAPLVTPPGYTRTINVPVGTLPGTYRIRLIYHEPEVLGNDWKTSIWQTNNIRNGIAYDFELVIESATGVISQKAQENKIYVQNGQILVEGVNDFEVFSIEGKRLIPHSKFPNGVYIIRVKDVSRKVIMK